MYNHMQHMQSIDRDIILFSASSTYLLLISIHTIQCRTRQTESRQKNIYWNSTKIVRGTSV